MLKCLKMKILIVYPEYPKSFWSFNRALELISNKSIFPPKELLRISILLPITWERKLVNLNSSKLKESDIKWADYVFISSNEKQSDSTIKTINKCISRGVKIVACGSLFTEYFEEFDNVNHLILDNINMSLPELINDLENEKTKKVYHSNPFFEIRRSTESYYSLTTISDSFSRNIQMA